MGRAKTVPVLHALLATLVMCLCCAQPVRADTIVVASDEWCPYNCQPDSDMPGYVVELLERVFAEHGHTIKYVVMPWKRALEDVRIGAVNAAICVAPEEAPRLFYPKEENGWFDVGFFTTRPDWKYAGEESLEEMVFGVVDGYAYGNPLDEMITHRKIEVEVMFGNTPLEFNMQKLQYGRIQGIIAERNVFKYTAKLRGLDGVFYYGGSASKGTPLYVGFSAKRDSSEKFARLFSDGIAKMRQSGELAALLSKYGLEDWK